ncbi:Ubiquitin carboxyl-terminal hydrolase 25 [Geranomyces michiganensis]|nr:Ubiquitin carboxyl-terminal hydrolase 25 [Geranomyces michiganensis]
MADYFAQSEIVDQTCPVCDHVYAGKDVKVSELPKILLVCLVRFQHDKGKSKKLRTPVRLAETINISEAMLTTGATANTKYNLQGFIIHQGDTMDAGHYISFVHLESGWIQLDDKRVTPVDAETSWQQGEQDAYLLSYARDEPAADHD